MRKLLILILGVLLGAPLAASAQQGRQRPAPRISITPLVGYRLAYTADGEFTIRTPDSLVVDIFDVEERRAAGETLGARLDVALVGPLGLIGEVAYGRSGDVDVTLRTEGLPDQEANRRGADLWFYKAGLSLQVPDPVTDSRIRLTAAPALLRESEDVWPFAPSDEATSHYALSVGVDAVTLGQSWFGLFLGAEDFIVFWDREARERAQEAALFDQYGGPTDVAFDYDPTHIFTFRIGASLSFF